MESIKGLYRKGNGKPKRVTFDPRLDTKPHITKHNQSSYKVTCNGIGFDMVSQLHVWLEGKLGFKFNKMLIYNIRRSKKMFHGYDIRFHS